MQEGTTRSISTRIIRRDYHAGDSGKIIREDCAQFVRRSATCEFAITRMGSCRHPDARRGGSGRGSRRSLENGIETSTGVSSPLGKGNLPLMQQCWNHAPVRISAVVVLYCGANWCLKREMATNIDTVYRI